MGKNIKAAKENILHNDGFFFTLIRSTISAQVCSWVDMLTSFLAFAVLNLTAWLSTALGAFIGGILNCLVNYRFTFHTEGVGLKVAITKFGFVWLGSMLLNSFGTEYFYHWIKNWHWLHTTVGLTDDLIFLVGRLTVSLAVSILWNFLLQKHFVFHTSPIDKYIQRFYERITPSRPHKNH